MICKRKESLSMTNTKKAVEEREKRGKNAEKSRRCWKARTEWPPPPKKRLKTKLVLCINI